MFKLFLQDSPNDCGAACLASILNHHGLYVTPIDLARNMAFSRAGTSNTELEQVAASHGLESRLIALECDEFHRLTDPCIAYVASAQEGLTHNVIIYRVEGERLWIADPGRGCFKTTLAEFAKGYEGLLLILRPGDSFKKGVISQSYSARFLRFVATYRLKIFLCLLLGLVTSSIAFGLIYLSKLFVDRVLPSGEFDQVLLFAGLYFLARLLHVATTGFNQVFSVAIRNSVNRALSKSFFNHSLDLEKRHIDNREMGDFVVQFSRIEMITQSIADYFSNFVLVVFGMLVKACYLIWLYDPVLVCIILFVLLLNCSLGFLFSAFSAENANRQAMVSSEMASSVLNSLSDIRVARIFGATSWLLAQYRRLLAEMLVLARRFASLEVYGRSLAELLTIISDAAIFIICGMRIIEGSYTLGDFLVFFAFAQGLSSESRMFPLLIISFQAQLRAFARVQAVFELSKETGGQADVEGQGLEIEFKDVCFAYVKGAAVLQQLSFVIKSNQTCAFVGESGSGKTTIMNLIMGFYKPSSGHILVNGKDLAELDLALYRRRLSAVFQDTILFNRSLYANVAMGNSAVDRERVSQIARTLGIHSFIEKLPLAYDQPLYPGSVSGGQTQQVGILRAMCKPHDLLIMDEATSHLDSRSEERIVNGIKQLATSGGARAIIAHRLSTVKSADRIIVMRAGRLVETGRHDELVALKGYYLELIERQYEINLVPSGQAE